MVRSREVQSPFAQTRLRHQYEADETASSSYRTQGTVIVLPMGKNPEKSLQRHSVVGLQLL